MHMSIKKLHKMQKINLKYIANLCAIHNLGDVMGDIGKGMEDFSLMLNEKKQSIITYLVFIFFNNSRKSSTASLSAGSREAHIFTKFKSASL